MSNTTEATPNLPEGQPPVESLTETEWKFPISLNDEIMITWGGVISQKPGDVLKQFLPESDYVIFFVNHGTLSVTIDDKLHVISKGHTLAIKRTEKLAGAEPNKEPLLCQWLSFHMVPRVRSSSEIIIEVPRTTKTTNPERIAELFRMITEEYHTANRPNAPEFRAFSGRGTQLLLLSLLSRLSEVEPEQPSKSDALTALAEHGKDYIRMNCLNPMSTTDIAQALDCSSRYLRKAFQNTFGYSPSAYILNTRVITARSYLISTRMPISEIARNCGFKNQNYFTRVSRAKEGVTPSEFRIAHSHRYTVPNI